MYYLEDFLHARCCSKLFLPVLASCLSSSLLNGLPQWLSGTVSACSARDLRDIGLIPGSGKYPGEGNGNPLQYCCQENTMDRGAWRAIVHGVTKTDMTEVTEHTAKC